MKYVGKDMFGNHVVHSAVERCDYLFSNKADAVAFVEGDVLRVWDGGRQVPTASTGATK